MKKIIFILALFVSFVANSQYTPPTGYTNINSRYDWLAGVFRALGLPAGGNAAFTTGQAMRAGSVYYDSTGVDSGLHVWTGVYWRNYATASYADADARAAISLTTTGTSGAATYNSGTGVFNIPVYAGTLNANVGAFYRWLKPSTQEIKTFAPGYGILIDSTTNTDALTAILDSSTVFPHIRATIAPNLLFDSLGAAGISPMTTWDNTLYARRISIAGGSIDTTASGGLLITVTGGSGVTTMGAIGASPNANGATITGTTLNLEPASASFGGVVTTSAQSFAGAKTFSGSVIANGGIITNSVASTSSNLAVPVSATGFSTTISALLFEGATSVGNRVLFRGNANYVLSASNSYANLIMGETLQTEASSGTHALIAGMVLKPMVITNAAGATTNMATLYIEGAPSGITPTGLSYAQWNKAGINRFDGMFNAGGTTLTANQIWGSNSGATAMEGKTLTNGQNIKITHGAGTATFAGATLTKNAMVENPTAAENLFMFRTPVAITVTDVTAVLVGGTPSVTYNIAFGTDRTSATNVYTAGQTVTSETTGTAASGVNDATIPAGSWVWITTSAATDVTQLNISLTYTED